LKKTGPGLEPNEAALKKLLLNLYYWPMFLLVTCVAITISPLILLGNLLFFRLPVDRLIRQSIRVYGWFLIRVVPFMAPVTLDDQSGGFEGPAIFVPNHSSSIDPYLFGLLPLDNAFVTSWPFRIPFYNLFMRLAGYIDSTQGWLHVEQQGSELLARGCSLIIWPEGHRSRDGRLGRFKNGAFQLALATGRPIVPVCILGSRRMLPPGNRMLTPSRIRLILLPPLPPLGEPGNPDHIKALKEKTSLAIALVLDNEQEAQPDNLSSCLAPECLPLCRADNTLTDRKTG
jgi:1-acyl-sn-glycerol-3-phosphate acyltransferase